VRLSSLHLVHFRSYASCDLAFPARYNLFTGANGQGKTNLIEAIYYCSALRSFRAHDAQDCIQHGRPFFHLQAEWEDDAVRHDLAIHHAPSGRTIRLDQKPLPSARRHARRFPVLFLSPQDTALAWGAPALRRDWFDRLLSLMKDSYGETLASYEKTLRQRNRELKQGGTGELWNGPLAEAGCRLVNARRSFLAAVRTRFQAAFHRFFEPGEAVGDLAYLIRHDEDRGPEPLDEARFLERLASCAARDRATATTGFGPHKDDFAFLLGDRPVREHASQGQTRLFVYALQWTVHEYLARALGRRPILLVDDIFSDLDEKRTQLLFEGLREAPQVFIASANEVLVRAWLGDYERFEIRGGSAQAMARPVHVLE